MFQDSGEQRLFLIGISIYRQLQRKRNREEAEKKFSHGLHGFYGDQICGICEIRGKSLVGVGRSDRNTARGRLT
jgi:hypothetical protein